jgi:putative acetyltransferase
MIPEILITPLEQSDAKELHALCTHPKVVYWLDGNPLETVESFQKKLEESTPHRNNYYLAARHGERLVGYVWLNLYVNLRGRRSAQLFMAVHPDFQRQGIGQQLLEELVMISDRWLDLLRLCVDVHFDNTAALRLFQKHGFVGETRRKEELFRVDQYIDTLQLARIRPDFHQAPEAILPPPAWLSPKMNVKDMLVRVCSPSDADAFTECFLDPSVYWGTFQLPYPPKELWRGRLKAQSTEPRHMMVAEIDGKVVGNLALHGFSNPRRAHIWWLGIGVHRQYQGAGVGHQLMATAMEFADQWLAARRIELTVYVDNTRAIKLYERHGFVLEGRNRCSAFRDGAYVDAFMMGRLRNR